MVWFLGLPCRGRGQEAAWRPAEGLAVGSEAERYLRILQVRGMGPVYPWTVREIFPWELPRVLPTTEVHPWAVRMDFTPGRPKGIQVGWVTPEARMLFNSSYPFGENDGPLWAGKGVTLAIHGGGYVRFGRLFVRIAPEAFWSQNQPFALADNGFSGEAAFRDGRWPNRIDKPQRFGDSSYGRIGLGSSEIGLRLPGTIVGVSGAAQQWGPGIQYPLLMGNNAGGFSHAFIQTASPLNLWLLKIHGRLLVGTLEQSDYSRVQEGEKGRYASAVTLTLSPRGLDQLELGYSRIIEGIWPEDGIGMREVLLPFGNITHDWVHTENPREENQLASAFFRLSVPGAGVEVFGQLLKEDFARELRHLLEEPDDLLGFSLGIQRVWNRPGGSLLAFRGEMVSAQVHHSERMDRFRPGRNKPRPFPHYIHAGVRQGHTQLGQILGSPAAYGGSGWTVGIDRYDSKGRTSIDLSRTFMADWLWSDKDTVGRGISDVVYALKLEAVRFSGGYQWTVFLNPALDLNRNVEEGNDVWNLGIGLAVGGLPW